MQKKDYTLYTTADFLEDDYFVNSMISPTQDSIEFWKNLLDANSIHQEEFEAAKDIITTLGTDLIYVDPKRIDNLWKRIQNSNRENQRNKKKRRYILLSSAASVACIIGAIFLFVPFAKVEETLGLEHLAMSSQDAESIKKASQIQLILPNDKVDLDENDVKVDYTSDKEIKVNEDIISKEDGINQLIVPYRKRSSIILSDGSKLWINAGTHIVYPSKFDSQKREIFVDGEVFADIKRDTKRPFIIKSKKLNVKVLGTKFNISTYETDSIHSVVLVSGSVEVNSGDQPKELLKPNQQFSLDHNTQTVRNVEVDDYIAWVDGYYKFKFEKLSNILQYLSKYYGVRIDYTPEAGDLKCVGGLDLKEDLATVLDGLQFSIPISFTQQDDGSYMFKKNTQQLKYN